MIFKPSFYLSTLLNKIHKSTFQKLNEKKNLFILYFKVIFFYLRLKEVIVDNDFIKIVIRINSIR